MINIDMQQYELRLDSNDSKIHAPCCGEIYNDEFRLGGFHKSLKLLHGLYVFDRHDCVATFVALIRF